jgi:hypothetical protein
VFKPGAGATHCATIIHLLPHLCNADLSLLANLAGVLKGNVIVGRRACRATQSTYAVSVEAG